MKNLVIIKSLLHQIKQNRENIETQLECIDAYIKVIKKELEEDMTKEQIKQKNRNEWWEKYWNDIVLAAVIGFWIILPFVVCIILDKIYG